MAEYIDREAAIKAIEFSKGVECSDRCVQGIKYIPAADVVEVVRCKDCVWYVKSEGVCTMVSSRGEPGVPIQCYCSHGVRRCKEGM